MSNISIEYAEQIIFQRLSMAHKKKVSKDVKFLVEPNQVQRVEKAMRQMFAFLNAITVTYTDQKSEEILSMIDGVSITQRTAANERRPVEPDDFGKRQYNCVDIEADVIIPWRRILKWGMLESEVYQDWRDWLIRARARDRLRSGFYGQSYNPDVDSDRDTYPMLEDVQKGWFRYMAENYPGQFLGLTADNSTRGYTLTPIKVGDGGDFINMSSLVQYLLDNVISTVYAGDTNIKAICGRTLTSNATQRLLEKGDEPIQESAAEMLIAQQSYAGKGIVIPDEMPPTGLMVCNPKVLELIIQGTSIRESVVDDPKVKGLIDYQWMQRDYVINTPTAWAGVLPGTLLVKNQSGEWTEAENWGIDPVT